MATLSERWGMLLPTALLWLLLIGPAQSVEYAVDGWKLGANVTSGSLRSYGCKADPALEQATS